EMRIADWRQRAVHALEHALILLRPGNRQHVGRGPFDLLGFRAPAAADADLAALAPSLAPRGKRFLPGTVEQPASVDADDAGGVMLAGGVIAFRAKAGDDAVGIHQRLGTPKRNKAASGRGRLLHDPNLPD